MFPDNPWFLLPKFADESCGRIWKFPKELSDLGGGGWNELKTDSGGWRGGGGGGGMNGPGQGELTVVMVEEKDYCSYCYFFLVLFQHLLTCLIDSE